MKPIGPKVLALRTSEIYIGDYPEKELREAYSEYFGPCPCCGVEQMTAMSRQQLVEFWEEHRQLTKPSLAWTAILDELRDRVICDRCVHLAGRTESRRVPGAILAAHPPDPDDYVDEHREQKADRADQRYLDSKYRP